MENEELPPVPPPFMPGFHILNPLGRQTENPQSSSEFHNVDQQSEQPTDDAPILGLLGLDRYAMEQERLSRKRKASYSPPATCKLSKLSNHTLEDPVCTACMSPILPSDLIQLSCDHSYCMECTMRLFTSAMTDETLFPPQCCGISIPLASVLSEVDTEFEEAFNKRQAELSTPASERIYCSNQACSLFLGRRTEGLQEDKVHCPNCHTETCITCKCVAHESSYCPQDPSVVSLMVTAASEGYKQCPSCHLVIELTFGCNHMSYVSYFPPAVLLPMLTQYHADVVVKINSALNASQSGRVVSVICGTRTASWSVQQCLSIETGLKPLCPAKLVMTTSETSLETLGRIMRAYTVIPGQRFAVSIGAKTAATTSTSSFLNVQIVGSGYAGGAGMGT